MYEKDADKFVSHGINGQMLLSAIDDESLQGIGIMSVMKRQKLLLAINNLKQKQLESQSMQASSKEEPLSIEKTSKQEEKMDL